VPIIGARQGGDALLEKALDAGCTLSPPESPRDQPAPAHYYIGDSEVDYSSKELSEATKLLTTISKEPYRYKGSTEAWEARRRLHLLDKLGAASNGETKDSKTSKQRKSWNDSVVDKSRMNDASCNKMRAYFSDVSMKPTRDAILAKIKRNLTNATARSGNDVSVKRPGSAPMRRTGFTNNANTRSSSKNRCTFRPTKCRGRGRGRAISPAFKKRAEVAHTDEVEDTDQVVANSPDDEEPPWIAEPSEETLGAEPSVEDTATVAQTTERRYSFGQMSKDDNGLVATVQSACEEDNDIEAELRRAFKEKDKNNRGNLAMDDFRDVVGIFGDDLTEEEMEDMIQVADPDAEGQINYEDFITRIMSK